MSIFPCTCSTFVYLLWRSVSSTHLFIVKLGFSAFLLLSCESLLYMLDTTLRCIICNIFFCSIGYLFTFLANVLDAQLFHFDESHFFCFSFVACVLDITCKNCIAKCKVTKIYSYIFSKKFRTSGIILNSRGEITFFFFSNLCKKSFSLLAIEYNVSCGFFIK